MTMASAPREPGWLEKNRGIMTLGNCVHVCECTPGKGLMGELVCGRHGDMGAFLTE